ncbi:heat shock protein HSP20 [Desulfofarcimen acetoxidans DSM 771]|uniref:Heat shock protein HSP20 n=1 Tax=Desulfofarcimen acetoxidans (strain ATCC 49208 / DSM 771 / KCTC 5769 / VKM B-1644 / 5575) TaxID=485916 RepID=C8W3I7_DESAS|nr:Hsp20/alpha crystallin family protein [Desulfofarcimen acetoxidans]ACV63773.1 heat shock protein HSP20 [Desulfofarcimen acetoxidans DSM 771]
MGKKNDEFDILNVGGFSNIFKGVANLLDLVSRMDREGKNEFFQTGEIGGGKKDGLKGVYGFSVKLGGNGPRVEQFGNVRDGAAGPVLDDIREPLTDVFVEDDHVLVILEMPGVQEKEIQVGLKDNILFIKTVTGIKNGRKYEKEVCLNVPVIPESLVNNYNNGILEIKLERKNEPV